VAQEKNHDHPRFTIGLHHTDSEWLFSHQAVNKWSCKQRCTTANETWQSSKKYFT